MYRILIVLLLPSFVLADELCITEKDGVINIVSGDHRGLGDGSKCSPPKTPLRARARGTSRTTKVRSVSSIDPPPYRGAHFSAAGKADRLFTHSDGLLSGPIDSLFALLISLDERSSGVETDPLTVVHYGDSHSGYKPNAMRLGLSEPPISPGYVTHSF